MARTRITPEIIQQARELAELGMGKSGIAESLGIGLSTTRNNRALRAAIQEGRSEARRRVLESLRDLAELKPEVLIRIAERIGAFSEGIEIRRPKSARDALEVLAGALESYGLGEISDIQAKTLQSLAKSYLEGYEKVEIEERIAAIEERLKDRNAADRNIHPGTYPKELPTRNAL